MSYLLLLLLLLLHLPHIPTLFSCMPSNPPMHRRVCIFPTGPHPHIPVVLLTIQFFLLFLLLLLLLLFLFLLFLSLSSSFSFFLFSYSYSFSFPFSYSFSYFSPYPPLCCILFVHRPRTEICRSFDTHTLQTTGSRGLQQTMVAAADWVRRPSGDRS